MRMTERPQKAGRQKEHRKQDDGETTQSEDDEENTVGTGGRTTNQPTQNG